MRNYILFLLLLGFISCENSNQEYIAIAEDKLRNKIAGGWAGKMIGVSYGAPTEFVYNGELMKIQ